MRGGDDTVRLPPFFSLPPPRARPRSPLRCKAIASLERSSGLLGKKEKTARGDCKGLGRLGT